MEQLQNIQYNPTQVNSGFNPLKPVDYTNALATEHERQLRAEREILEQMRRNEGIEQANDRQKIEGVRAIAEFSKTAAEELGNLYVEDAVRQRKEAFTKELLNPSEVSPDYVEGKKQAESEFVVSQKVAGEIGKVDYEAATPFRNESVWAQMGRTEAQALMAIENELPQIISEATKQFSVLPPNEREERINQVVADFAESKGLTGMRRSFLEEKILPTIRNVKKADSRQYRIAWGKREAARQIADLERTLQGRTPDTIIPELAAIAGKDGYPMGFPAAWDMFQTMVANNVITGAVPQSDYENMRNTVIPEGNPGAGQTYGEFYKSRFFTIDRAIAKGEIDLWREGENQEEMEADNHAEAIAKALLDDPEGFTSDTLDDLIQIQTDTFQGRGVEQLEKLRASAIDVKYDKALEKRLDNLARTGDLSVRLLSSVGASNDLYNKFIKKAEALDKAKAVQTPAFIKAIVRQGGIGERDSIAATPDGSRDVTVGEAEISLDNFYKKTLSELLDVEGMTPEKAAQEAKIATFKEYKENPIYEVTSGGYEAFNPLKNGSTTPNVQAAREQREQIIENANRISGYIDKGVDAFKNTPNVQAAFTRNELEELRNTYATIDFEIPQKAKALGRAKGIDPFQVINRQLIANGMEPLPESAAIKTFTDNITPAQQRILNKNPTPANSIRVLGSAGEFKREIVPKGYGSLVVQASVKHDIPPSILAGLIETESAWNPSAISSAGAVGLGQFMPDTAAEFGVNRNDPESSIDGAARYLRYLVNYFDGDLVKAIYAYNGGMGRIQRLGVGYDGPGGENYNYYPKVMKSAYKYGYKQALNDPSIVRPAFQ